MKKTLYEALKEHQKIPMHMPGHKRNTDLLGTDLPYDIDITEIDGFDNLHEMQGVLKNIGDLGAKLYGAKASFPLVNGSTCGILAAMHALCPFGGTALIARNCHKSVYHGASLLGLTPHYLLPETDDNGIFQGITAEKVETALQKHPEINLVILTSPTYEGVVSDISAIAAVCHANQAFLLLDCAHGAHLGLLPKYGGTTDVSSADVVVMSLHKTLPALTQTAMLHLYSNCVTPKKLSASLSVFETSSPSYVLLASIDRCLHWVEQNGAAQRKKHNEDLASFYEGLQNLQHLSVTHFNDADKIILCTRNTNLTGEQLAIELRKKGIETEMAQGCYVLAMASICDKREHLQCLKNALFEIDQRAEYKQAAPFPLCALPQQEMTVFDAASKKGTFVPLEKAKNRICLEFLWAYPPGIPLLVPGEKIGTAQIDLMQHMLQAGVALHATNGFKNNHIFVMEENEYKRI